MLAFDDTDQLQDADQDIAIQCQASGCDPNPLDRIIGNSPQLADALRQAGTVAATEATVLVLGETGTGKELVAQAIHDMSPRRNAPLIKVNCAAISAGLVESELFGHEKGSFTGAVTRRTGRFEAANGGTLFLDEVGELPLDTQVKLLRVLQEGEFERVGSNQPIKVDVRIIAATNRDLDDRVRAGEFRADLLYRLNVFPLQIPPLRARVNDIPALVEHFLARLSPTLGKRLDGVSKRSMAQLKRYPWPGNIRELQNAIERAAILATTPIVEIDDANLDWASSAPVLDDEQLPTLEAASRRHIITALERTNWMISGKGGAAEVLDINPNTLRSRMKKLGIRRAACTA
ncbi:MAG: sigma-54 dependent transcriptional regulator [Pseudomonadales bacterium]